MRTSRFATFRTFKRMHDFIGVAVAVGFCQLARPAPQLGNSFLHRTPVIERMAALIRVVASLNIPWLRYDLTIQQPCMADEAETKRNKPAFFTARIDELRIAITPRYPICIDKPLHKPICPAPQLGVQLVGDFLICTIMEASIVADNPRRMPLNCFSHLLGCQRATALLGCRDEEPRIFDPSAINAVFAMVVRVVGGITWFRIAPQLGVQLVSYQTAVS